MSLPLSLLSLALAAFPWAMALPNLARQRRPQEGTPGGPPPATLVSILIPARDEAANITPCLRAALASTGVAVEVLVMDDGSRDDTPAQVRALAAEDERVRLLLAPPLPPGWTGKVHACARLAEAALGTHFLFLDADVRLAPGAAAALAAEAEARGLALVSAVPRQILGGLGEALTVPVINLLMLGYLPGGGRAESARPEMAAACGQLLLAEAGAYRAAGGHAAAPGILHDGLALARRLRAAGHRTEVVDGTALATCRMYDGLAPAWAGFAKNAREGMATPRGLPVWTLLLGGGHLLPWLALGLALPPLLAATPGEGGGLWAAILAVLLSLGLRAAITARVGEPWWSVPLHPFAIAVALAIQWQALLTRRPPAWKGRAYGPGSVTGPDPAPETSAR
ncbi:glycosyltransferase [Roseomonas sp. GC11]|uniref:glycosyltransferase family 2 protein n=1 Tax=Roseomonas sp. GC11 TaxID=2950546 RepID=UPI002109F889|nr:glycosyltransferase [Roseomonas sp. GC11]MCQ4162300.1 glycosyltransferase [Roseomonas sp. GC11]